MGVRRVRVSLPSGWMMRLVRVLGAGDQRAREELVSRVARASLVGARGKLISAVRRSGEGEGGER